MAFTLIELMIVVGIMGIILTMGVPLVYKTFHKAPMARALKDTVEVLSHARGQAIMQAREVDVFFHPRESRLEISGAAAPAPPGPPAAGAVAGSGSGFAAVLSDRVYIQALGINLVDYTESELARVRFYPNGTCDEMLMILRSTEGEQRGISLEVTTGLASVLNERELQALVNRLH
jgi:prepilin-type N-terminal cleavage/methylation domain-containing protein